jgi:ribose-phosphate pyrophosphokinase
MTKHYFLFDDIAKIVTYPSGETHAMINPGMIHAICNTGNSCTVEFQLRTWNQLMSLIAIDQTIKDNNINVDWFIPYMPFARDDRRRSVGCANELQLAMELLRSRGVRVTIADPHSYVSEYMRHIPQNVLVDYLMDIEDGPFKDRPVVLIPDAGAAHKAHVWLRRWEKVFDYAQGIKKRDPNTGALSGFEIQGWNIDWHDRPVIIVDDICDGGGTFLGLAECLRVQHFHVAQKRLLVTHGLFTQGFDRLFEVFDHIYSFGDSINSTEYYTAYDWHKVFVNSKVEEGIQ